MKNIERNFEIMRETLIDVSNGKTSCDSQTAIYALRYIQELQDKLHRRNLQIKDLKAKLHNPSVDVSDFNSKVNR